MSDILTLKRAYQITLNIDELEFLRHLLGDLNKMVTSGLARISFPGIDSGALENKIFQQFYDADGKLR